MAGSDARLDPERTGWRVTVASPSRMAGDPDMTVAAAPAGGPPDDVRPGLPLVDGQATTVRLDRRDDTRALLVEGEAETTWRTPVLFGPRQPQGPGGELRRELVVDGWRVEVEVEHARRAELRERARVIGAAAAGGGPVEVRAMIPGKIVAVDVRPGTAVTAGQRVLVIEAMKMQNELVAPREGIVDRIAVEPGATVERDDLLMVIR